MDLKNSPETSIGIADLKDVPLAQSGQNQSNLLDIKKMLFRKEIKRFSKKLKGFQNLGSKKKLKIRVQAIYHQFS